MSFEKIAWYSFPFNHLITIQLLKNTNQNDNKLKPLHFFMFSLVPGVIKDDNERTYSYSDIINIKYSIQEIEGLSFVLKQYALGNVNNINYVKFSSSNNVDKYVTLMVSDKKTKIKDIDIVNRIINIKFSVSNNASKVVSLSCDNAYSIGEVLHQLFKIACKLEFNRNTNLNGEQIYEHSEKPSTFF